MDQVVIVVMSRFGNVQSHHIRCDFKLVCTHKFKVTRQMIPKATVIAYHLKDKTTIYQGKTELTLDTIGKNFVSRKKNIKNIVNKRKFCIAGY